MSIAVFLGPSLPRAEAEAILAADYRPPVRQGDIYRLLQQDRPAAIALIDGYFQEVPSVWHKEILWAMDRGVAVYGAASMGALRAAELACYGMVGVGKIFEAYRTGSYAPYTDGPFEDDDEVAVIHGPAELSYPPLSVAMVDLRETLAKAVAAGVIDSDLRDALVAAFKRRFYRARSFEALPEILTDLEVARETGEALQAWLAGNRVSQKQADARMLLETLASGGAPAAVEGENFIFERTTLWAQFVERAETDPPAPTAAEQAVLEELRLDPELYTGVRDIAVLRLRLDAADPPPPADEPARRAALDRLRHRHGLWSRGDLDAWAEACDLDRAGLDRLLDFEAALESCAVATGAALEAALLDVLRRDGHYPALAARARDKTRRLAAAPEASAAPSAPSPAALLEWYFESILERGVPIDLSAYAVSLGFVDVEALLAALARERAYRLLCGEAATAGES
ncbi:MAG: TfuA-like protein [Kiloniellaceae bacterium]